MKKFFVLFTCAKNSQNHYSWMKLSLPSQNERLEKGTLAMEQWSAKYGSKIVHQGSSLGERTMSVDSRGIHETPSRIGKFMIIEAVSFEEAARMFLDHPHFSYFPGDGVEILELVESRS